MKNSIAILSLSALAVASVQTASAGDREWATVGKVLTGVAAAHVISHAFAPAPVYAYAPAPVVVAAPAPPICHVPPPVPVVVYPAPVCVAPPPVVVVPHHHYPVRPVVSVNFGFGHKHRHYARGHCW